MLPRHDRNRERQMDERHDCQDIGPAYVPSTVWGTASSQTAKFRSAPCLPLESSKLLRATRAGSQPATDQRNSNIQLSIGSPIETPLPASADAGKSDPAGIPRRIGAGSGRHRTKYYGNHRKPEDTLAHGKPLEGRRSTPRQYI